MVSLGQGRTFNYHAELGRNQEVAYLSAANLRLSSQVELELEHRRGDLTGGDVGNRGRGAFEYEQSCTGNITRKRFAVADREERVGHAPQ